MTINGILIWQRKKEARYSICKSHSHNFESEYLHHNDFTINRACQSGHKEIVELLFKAGADGMTASCSCLISAINGGHIEVVQCILNSVPELIQVS